jgi:hypothetical protein
MYQAMPTSQARRSLGKRPHPPWAVRLTLSPLVVLTQGAITNNLPLAACKQPLGSRLSVVRR